MINSDGTKRRTFLASVSSLGVTALAGCSSESDGGDSGGDNGGDGGDDSTPTSTPDPVSQLEMAGDTFLTENNELAADIGVSNPTDQSVTAEFTASIAVADNRGELTSETIEETIPAGEAPNIFPSFDSYSNLDWEKLTGYLFYGGILQISVNGESQPLSCFDDKERYESTSEACEYFGQFSTHVEVEYSGNWEGAAGSAGNTRSISRSSIDAGAPQGEDTSYISISEDANIVSANAQKQEANSEELTIRIVDGREVIAEQSTSSEYGVAQVSETL